MTQATVQASWAIIFNFHGIGEPDASVPQDERPYWCRSEEWPRFANAVAHLRDRGAPVALTFDDGNLSDVTEALPVLAERGLVATFHPCAGRIDRTGYLSAEQLATLRKEGMRIGSHGWGHVDLRRVDDAGLAREADESRRILTEASGGPVDEFAIPFGSYDRRVLGGLRGYRRVYTSDRDRTAPTAWLQPRYSYTSGWTPDTVKRLATEAPPLWPRVKSKLARGVKRLR